MSPANQQQMSAEQQRKRRDEDELLGRLVWAASTRDGTNLAAPTTAELRALGATVRAQAAEAARIADAAVRAAADTATFGLADEISAGTNVLMGYGGQGAVSDRYARLHAEELQKDEVNRETRPLAVKAGELGMAMLTFKGAAKSGSGAVSQLPSRTKGQIGERMSDGRTLLSGEIPIKHGKRLDLEGGGYTFTDHQTKSGTVVEAKLGPQAQLSHRQKQAKAELGPRYRHDQWTFDDVGRVVGGAAVATQQGIGRVSKELQDAIYGRD